MRRLGASLRSAYAAALCALALLSFAQVQSAAMQAAQAAPGATCAMPGMGPMQDAGRSKPDATHKACAYCAAAAHAPVLADAATVRTPAAVVWTVSPPRRTLGARGPPAFRSRARDPPSPPLTA